MGYDKWHWQEIGKAWKGVGIYHVTLTTPKREHLFGELEIPENDPLKAIVKRTEYGDAVVEALLHVHDFYPETRVLQFCLMPDHLHAIIQVTREMSKGFLSVSRGYWQGVKRIGREMLPEKFAEDGFIWEKPFVRPMSRKGQLNAMIHYVQMNPIRLATKILKPGFFYVQRDVEINGYCFNAVGDISILQAKRFVPVHVRHKMEELARIGEDKSLRDYMNGCVLDARKGAVMVSPFISKNEQRVLEVLIKEGHTIIYIANNGFREYYKPSNLLFDAVANGRVLILAPTYFDPDKRLLTREDCISLNKITEEICIR